MPKRKRTDPDVGDTFTKWQTELFRALKLAKGFERQQQAKRLRKQPDKAERVNKEIVVLKSLDLQRTAEAVLKSSLLRIKAAAESPRLPAEIRAGPPKPDISDEERLLLHNVTSSLANQKPVREVIDKALVAICEELSVSPPEKRKGKRQQAVVKAENDGPRYQLMSDQAGGEENEGKGQRQRSEKRDGRDTAPSRTESQPRKAVRIDDDLDSEQQGRGMARFEETLGSSSEIEEDEGGTKAAFMEEKDPMEITSGEEESDDGLSDVEFDSQAGGVDDMQVDIRDEDGSRSASPPRKKKTTTQGLRSGKFTDSTFLPSLMSGYISGSEEASDIEDEVGLNQRTNRRGQRARQAIWEKKYKEKAKHLQQDASKGAVWDPKRGAVDKDRTRPWKKGAHTPLARKQGARNRDGPDFESRRSSRPQPAHKKVEDTGPLHPSWEAAKKAKEKNQTAPFQGKKITFD